NAPKTILVGDNAQGKTNVLEALGFLSTLKSSRVSRDRDLVREGEPQGQIIGMVSREYRSVKLGVVLRRSGRRTVSVDEETCRRNVDFLGLLNVVQFSSLDLELVRSGPETRRNWLDGLLVQLEPIYAHILQQYNKVLKQRNALLKEIRSAEARGEKSYLGPEHQAQLGLWDAQLATIGVRVMQRRSRALDRLVPIAETWHAAISGRVESLCIHYAPNVEGMQDKALRDSPQQAMQAFLEKLQSRAIAESFQGTTLVGPHRDDIEFTLNELPVKQFASQGQQRTLVLALKLAELKLIEEIVGEPPVLLLDDVLAELDPKRQNQLLEAIQDRFQTVIATTHLGGFEHDWINSAQILTVKGGEIFP
ncbi:MAG: DNA replication/repair protein RecF, partial [Chroococcales cyanobacterium]